MKYLSEQPLRGATIALAVAGLAGCGGAEAPPTVADGNAAIEAAKTAGQELTEAAAGAVEVASNAAAGSVDLAHCYDANICQGHNDCKTANNACAGQGACKGQGGFVAMPVKACGDVGGKVQDEWRGQAASADLVHCYGVNTCQGHNDCKTAGNACAGQGACSGQGFVATGEKACADIGGKVGA